jgi:glutathione S-transferase
MTIELPVPLKGSPASPYTRKMLAVLRYRRIPYRFLVGTNGPMGDLPQPKVDLLPTFYLPDADGRIEAVVDSTPIIRRLEQAVAGRSVVPTDAVTAFIDAVLEDYADEWLTKAMFHYRWHYAADIDKAGEILPRWRDIVAPDDTIAQLKAQFSARQIRRLGVVGSNPGTAAVIEASYLHLLDVLATHFTRHPFLMGRRPGASDFGFYGQLTQLTHFDPTPSALTLAHAPRVTAWVDLVEDLSGQEPSDSDWLERDTLAATLGPLLGEVGRTYVPVMIANARALKAGAEVVRTEVGGRPWEQQPFPYQGKCLQWLRAGFAALDTADRAVVDALLEGAGCGALLHAPV